MKKINNRGFALVETLIVTAFVVGIFSVMYANFYPMMGEYEKRENYDDISSIYNTNLFKNLIEKSKDEEGIKKKIDRVTTGERIENHIPPSSYNGTSSYNDTGRTEVTYVNSVYEEIEEEDFSDNVNSSYYKTLVENLNVEKVYLLPYKIDSFKSKSKKDYAYDFDIQTQEYIDYLPEFKNNSYRLECRIIVKYKAGENRESNNNNSDEYKFSTIGVDCK